MSGAEPWIGSYNPRRRPSTQSPSDADASNPIDPASIDASSVRMSPNIFSVTITSNSFGERNNRIAHVSTSMCSSSTSGNSSRITRSVTLRHSRDVSSTLALSTDVTLLRRERAAAAATRTTRSISAVE